MRTRASLRSAWLPVGAGALISLVAVWLVARDIDWVRFAQALAVADLGWVGLGVAAIVATFFVRAWRWAALLRPTRHRGSTIMAAMLAGQTLNYLFPLRAGDVFRSAMLSRISGSGFERVLGSVAIEKVWDWLALTFLVLALALLAPLPEWFLVPARTFGIVAVLLLAGLALTLSQRRRGLMLIDRLTQRFPFRWRTFVLERLDHLLDGMESLRRRDAAWRAAISSALTWLLGVAANAAVMRAFGVHSWPAAMFLMAVLMIGVALPPSIAALGLFEALSVLALGAFGVARDTALAIGVALHLVVYLPPILVGSMLIAWESWAGRLLGPASLEAHASHPLNRIRRD